MMMQFELYIPDQLGISNPDDLHYIRTAIFEAAQQAAEERVCYWKRLLAFIRQEA